jgi:hypothetical protein
MHKHEVRQSLLCSEGVRCGGGNVSDPSEWVVALVTLQYLQVLEHDAGGAVHGHSEPQVDRPHLCACENAHVCVLSVCMCVYM